MSLLSKHLSQEYLRSGACKLLEMRDLTLGLWLGGIWKFTTLLHGQIIEFIFFDMF